ncbi:anaerobic sulfite reductase subunit AsrB [Thermanaerosceptrum fracticalcis]|uniref:Anaerobic sulfite reductase subunit AsrB n=1 Tax=Thermanaerosceptrum fracticalcis TaxID=1712410 RepID=A0A7G6E1V4_THEFR|nr:anaerobic sulfite reductase subunit AsrB [Thermanaerosceptrum fracticalcis]QNB46058.1 anaerobic sulfite reductase subunit AsrB [Thermanaerosceptrum fracticalcis]
MITNPYLPQPAEIISITKETTTDYTFRLKTDIQPDFGQFVEVSIPKVGEAPISVSNAQPGWIELTIRRVGHLTNELHELKPGDLLFIRGPYGKGFPKEQYRDKSLIIAAGGTGLAPVRNLINYYYQHPGEVRQLSLLMGFKTPEDILFKEDIEKWRSKFKVLLTVDKESPGWSGHVGLITNFVKDAVGENSSASRVIIVGPPLMMKFTSQEFIKYNIPEENIWLSFERKMCCGIGKCGHCRINDTYVCLEGPVFPYITAKNLLD